MCYSPGADLRCLFSVVVPREVVDFIGSLQKRWDMVLGNPLCMALLEQGLDQVGPAVPSNLTHAVVLVNLTSQIPPLIMSLSAMSAGS